MPAKNLADPAERVSPQVQKLIAAPLRNGWNVLPKTGEEWKPIADAGAEPTIKNLPAGLLERMNVKIEKSTIDGVRVFMVTPATIAPNNQNRVVIHMHGGCYVLNPREAGLPEAVMMAGLRRLQGDRGRVPHAARGLLPGGARRRHDGLQERAEDDERRRTSG